jgi:Arylsulfotransferase (ASST)
MVVLALGLGLGLGLGLRSSAGSEPQLAALPFPGTPDVSLTAQIKFLGLAPSDIGNLEVEGSESGPHDGNIVALVDDRGVAFAPGKPFWEGETVTVSVQLASKKAAETLSSNGAKKVVFTFDVAVIPQAAASSTESTSSDATQSETQTPQTNTGPTQSFVSAPDLTPPVVNVSTPDADTSSSCIFVDSQFAAQFGPMILDSSGNLVWFEPLSGSDWALDVRVQEYEGRPVLTWWQGELSKGHGSGVGVIVDQSYEIVTTVEAGEGYSADGHEFLLTSHGTAWMTIYQSTQADLSSVGGPSAGPLLDCIVQEVDVKTGQVLWEWHALGHVPLSASYSSVPDDGSDWDFFHINSLQETADGNLLVSARNTWAVYLISRKTGAILWQLGGKGGSITLGPGVQFEWQHDARLLPDGTLTVFDNASSPEQKEQSRGLNISIDVPAQSSTVRASCTHTPPLLANSQGNMQQLAGGNWFVGWGDQGQFTEFAPDGTMLFDASFAKPAQTYRAYRADWEGHPTQPPSVAVTSASTGDATVYASWNGATGVESWQVLAGNTPDDLSVVASAASVGFETSISVSTAMPYIAVRALDSAGQELGTSTAVHD